MATAEYWQGDDGEYYSKDEYGNVFNSGGGMIGNDMGYGPTNARSNMPFQVSGTNATGAYSYESPGFPSQYRTQFNPLSGAGAGGGGQQSGVGIQPGLDWQQLELQRQQLQANISQNQSYQAYLNQQLQQQALTDSQRIAIERERVQLERENQALRQKQFDLEKAADEFQRGMQISQVLANPRNLVQSLMLLGGTPQQAAGYLQQLPTVQQLGAQPGVGQEYGWTPPAGGLTLESVQNAFGQMPSYQQLLQSASQASGGQIDPTTGRSALFPFVTGRKLPAVQTLSDIQSNNPRAGVIASLAGFSGQDPNAFFGEFDQFLPKGSTGGLTSVR